MKGEKRVLKLFIYRILFFLERFFLAISKYFSSISKKSYPILSHWDLVKASTSYDMVGSPSENYYADQYWRILKTYLPNKYEKINVYDLGCSQGRFSAKIALEFPNSTINACDLSEDAISQAKKRAKFLGVINRISYEIKSIENFLATCENNSADVLVMTEVAFFYPQWINNFPSMVKVLRLHGIIVMSFRPQYYDALQLTKARLFNNVDKLLSERNGSIYDTNVTYSWQKSQEIREMFESEPTLQVLEICAIGACSGIAGDPHASIC